MDSIALIPARIGSKGIPRKNLLDLGGFPLVAWAVRAAIASEAFQRVVISSDDEEIIDTAMKFGATDSILRPSNLALDSTTQFEVMQNAIECFEDCDSIVLLQPTAPFRRAIDIINAVKLNSKSPSKTLVSVVDASKDSETLFHDGDLIDLRHNFQKTEVRGTLRQNFLPRWKRNGCIYIVSRNQLSNQSLYSERLIGYQMPRWSYCNIDDSEDVHFAHLQLHDSRIREIRKELFG